MSTTQEHLAISDIQNDILLLKNGGGALVLSVSAVNFGLLSDRERIAIISAFAQMLNSLSFSIQIVIMSEKLNISSYLTLLNNAQKAQTNPLLAEMINNYKAFIQKTIKENEVLDKKFYIIIPLFALELGLTASKEHLEQKIKTVLMPRKDQIVRQLGRVGLGAVQLTRKELIKLFYDIYNGAALEEKMVSTPINPADLTVRLKQPEQATVNSQQAEGAGGATVDEPPTRQPVAAPQPSRAHPFVVEELE